MPNLSKLKRPNFLKIIIIDLYFRKINSVTISELDNYILENCYFKKCIFFYKIKRAPSVVIMDNVINQFM